MGPGGKWFVFGRVEEFEQALKGDGRVTVRMKDGTTKTQQIERCSGPNSEGYGYAWPIGTIQHEITTVQLPRVEPERPVQWVSTKSYRKRRAIQRRTRSTRGPARGP